MKRLLIVCVAAGLWACHGVRSSTAADTAPATASDTNASKEVRAVVKKVEAKLQQGKDKEADFAAEMKEFDELISRLKTTAPDAAANAAFMRALLYVQVLDDPAKGADLMKAVQNDFPKTKFGEQAGEILTSLEKQAKAKKVAESLAPGVKFPEFSEMDLNGKPLSPANYKGKVVLLDFWATWCGPCRAELPNVIETYGKYHSKGFEVIGISLDQDKTKLKDFIKEKNMPWPQYFDGKGWGNKLAQDYGITSIPATFLLDAEGKIIAKDVRGEALGEAVAKALEKK